MEQNNYQGALQKPIGSGFNAASTAQDVIKGIDLTGKTAIITGGHTGIGLETTKTLVAAGATVIVLVRDVEKAKKNLQGITNIELETIDLMEPESIEAFAQKFLATGRPIHLLINNAGIQHIDRIEDFPDDRWDAVIAINLSSSFHTTKAVVGGMKKRGWGRIVNISSVHGLVASVEKVAYIAAKHGLIGVTKVTALENAGTGVTCNAICPGWVQTPLVMAQIQARADRDGISTDQATLDLLSEKQPSGQFTTIDQLGAAAIFLCGEAASNMSGTTMTLDGAWSAQ